MRIACIGNMNNNFFSLARHLRDRGYDTDVLLFKNELEHFHPSADCFDQSWREYCTSLSWGDPYELLRVNEQTIRANLANYDVLIGCGSAPAYLSRIGRTLDVFVPYGTDLIYWPFLRFGHPKHQWSYYHFARAQRLGIQRSACIHLDATNPQIECILQKLKVQGRLMRRGVPMLYTPDYAPERISRLRSQCPTYPTFEKIRNKHSVVVFHQARHVWGKRRETMFGKGNHKLIAGFAHFVKHCRSENPCLVMFEYGKEVERSKALVRELGIEHQVYWFPKATRKEIMVGLSVADVGTGEFNVSWLSGGAIYETLALAKPLIHYREDSLYQETYPSLYPMIHARTSEQIGTALCDYAACPSYYRSLGEQGREWFQEYAIAQPLAEYERILQSKLSRTGAA